MQHFLADAHLFEILLAGIGMIAVHDDRRIFIILFLIEFIEAHQVLVVIIGQILSVLVDRTAQNRVGVVVAGGFHRIMIQVDMEDATSADEIFTILMGEKVEPRREFIEKNAKYVRNLDV